MKKLLAVINISFKNIFEYRLNFLIGQLRQLILLLTLFYVWKAVFFQNTTIFGFNFIQIVTYLFLVQIIRAIALDTRTDGIADEIAGNGKFFSYLLRPVGYLRYWLSIDLAYKIINFLFSLIWLFIIAQILHIRLFLQTNPFLLLLFIVSLCLSTLIYFFMNSIVSLWAFWTPQVWGAKFSLSLLIEFTSGAFFPLSILPLSFQNILNLTPFPYLVFFPANVYLGKLPITNLCEGLLIQAGWCFVFYLLNRLVWIRGLKVYSAFGG